MHLFVALATSNAASNELGSILILLSGFTEAIGIPGLFVIVEQLIKLKFLVQQVELKMADIEQKKRIVPLITCEIHFSQHLCELVLVSM